MYTLPLYSARAASHTSVSGRESLRQTIYPRGLWRASHEPRPQSHSSGADPVATREQRTGHRGSQASTSRLGHRELRLGLFCFQVVDEQAGRAVGVTVTMSTQGIGQGPCWRRASSKTL